MLPPFISIRQLTYTRCYIVTIQVSACFIHITPMRSHAGTHWLINSPPAAASVPWHICKLLHWKNHIAYDLFYHNVSLNLVFVFSSAQPKPSAAVQQVLMSCSKIQNLYAVSLKIILLKLRPLDNVLFSIHLKCR